MGTTIDQCSFKLGTQTIVGEKELFQKQLQKEVIYMLLVKYDFLEKQLLNANG